MKKKSKFLYIAFVDLDTFNASSTHPIEFLKGMSNNGCIIDAIFPKPKRKITSPNINFHFIYPTRFNNLGRFYFYLLSFLISVIILIFKKYDFIYIREMINNPFPRWLSKIYKIAFIIELNSNRLLNVSKKEIKYHKIYRDQSKNFNVAKLIVTSNPYLKIFINKLYNIPDDKILFCINGVDFNNTPRLSKNTGISMDYLKNKFCIGYLGTIWKYYDLHSIMLSLYLLKEKINNIHLIFIGDGPDRGYIENLKRELNLQKYITITGFVKSSELKHYLKHVNIGLMNLTKKGIMNGGPVTTRFGSYAINKIPTIASNIMIEEYPEEIKNNLFLVTPGDSEELSEKILYIYKNPVEAKQKAENLYNYVIKEMTWEKVTQKILCKIKDTLELHN